MLGKTILFLLVVLGNIFGLSAFAQTSSVPSGFAMEITFLKGRPPAYQAVPTSSVPGPAGAWYTLFNRIPDFKTSGDRLPVRAVKFVPYLENDLIKFNVSVYTGIKFHENEETVGVYSAHENERVTIKELKDFGVEPFEITILRVAPAASDLPQVINKTNSLQIAGVEPNFSTLPTYKIRLVNNSQKTVSALTYETQVDGRMRLSSMPHDERANPLIKTGGMFEKTITNALEYKKSSDGLIPAVLANQTFVITSVIFEDGSYEGDAQAAILYRAFMLGDKLQLKRILAFIQSYENKRAEPDLNQLAEQALKLEIKVDITEANQLSKDFPDLNEKQKASVSAAAEISTRKLKNDFVKDLELQLRKSNPTAALNWLGLVKKEYQNWLKRLP